MSPTSRIPRQTSTRFRSASAKALLALILVLAGAPAWAVISVGQKCSATTTGTSAVCTFGAAITPGSTIVVCATGRLGSSTETITGIVHGTDTGFTLLKKSFLQGNQALTEMWSMANVADVGTGMTVTFSASRPRSVEAVELLGARMVSPADDPNTISGSGTAVDSGVVSAAAIDQAINMYVGCLGRATNGEAAPTFSGQTGSGLTWTEQFDAGVGGNAGAYMALETARATTAVDATVAATATTSGNWTGVIGVFKELPPQATVTISKAGPGRGRVTAAGSALSCGATCVATSDANVSVALVTEAVADSYFTGWSGDADCTDGVLDMAANRACTATFALKTYFPLDVTKAGPCTGTVRSAGKEIDCGADCYQQYVDGSVEWLNAYPDANCTFAGWSGTGCTLTSSFGQSLLMTQARTCTATFNTQAGAAERFYVKTLGQDDTTKCTGLADAIYDGAGGPDPCSFATLGYALDTARTNGFSCPNGDDVTVTALTNDQRITIGNSSTCQCPDRDNASTGPCIIQGAGTTSILKYTPSATFTTPAQTTWTAGVGSTNTTLVQDAADASGAGVHVGKAALLLTSSDTDCAAPQTRAITADNGTTLTVAAWPTNCNPVSGDTYKLPSGNASLIQDTADASGANVYLNREVQLLTSSDADCKIKQDRKITADDGVLLTVSPSWPTNCNPGAADTYKIGAVAPIQMGSSGSATRTTNVLIEDFRIQAGMDAGIACQPSLYCQNVSLVDLTIDSFADLGFGTKPNPLDAAVQFDASAAIAGFGSSDGNILDNVIIDGDEAACFSHKVTSGARVCGSAGTSGFYGGGTVGIDVRNSTIQDLRGGIARPGSSAILQDNLFKYIWCEDPFVDDGCVQLYNHNSDIFRRNQFVSVQVADPNSAGAMIRVRRTSDTGGGSSCGDPGEPSCGEPAGVTAYNNAFLATTPQTCGVATATDACGPNTWGFDSGLINPGIRNDPDGGASQPSHAEMNIVRNIFTNYRVGSGSGGAGTIVATSAFAGTSPRNPGISVCPDPDAEGPLPFDFTWKGDIFFNSAPDVTSPSTCSGTRAGYDLTEVQVDPNLDVNNKPTSWSEACFPQSTGFTARDGDIADGWVGWSSGACLALTATCSNGATDGGNGETARDCGGANCPKCVTGLACTANGDCQSGNCSGLVCAAAVSTVKSIVVNISSLGPAGRPPRLLWRYELAPGEVIGISESQ